MNRFLFLVSVFCALCITVTHSALKPQGDDGETDVSLHERLSRIEAIMIADDSLRKRLGALEKEIKRVGEENKLLQDVVAKQDSTLKQLTEEIKKLRSHNVKMERFCKETSAHIKSIEEDENCKQFFVQKHPQTNRTRQDNGLMVNNNAGRTEGKYEDFASTNQDTKNRNHLGNNDFIRQLHIRQIQVGQVAFYSTVSVPDLINLGLHHTVVFDRVITNIGGAYHLHTGIFITPVDGVYVFILGAMSSLRKFIYLDLVQDGSFMQSIFPDAGTIESFATDSLVAVLELNKGNEVWVRTSTGSGEIHGNSFTFFSGWLLFMK